MRSCTRLENHKNTARPASHFNTMNPKAICKHKPTMTVRRLILLFFSDNKKAMANIATAPSSPQTIFNESTSKILFKKSLY
ncbi:hypothetical protein MUS_3518 [Bacillus velezensis YAU B9601-Y2]|uniref:Uncharacterized protein n=1 Tax=Bacillus amyloliquefaciens (strain Y2) TaxID=1155777 RepID=I2C9R5_BACAY|nr:hypothetical protein MUS_3518 [Bacillus velezensis YAU B9601-Y2]KYC90190.1 hypothetical protein B4140_3178 [Bacillus amyloliquefaciens]